MDVIGDGVKMEFCNNIFHILTQSEAIPDTDNTIPIT